MLHTKKYVKNYVDLGSDHGSQWLSMALNAYEPLT